MTPQEKITHIRKFCMELYKMHEEYPDILKEIWYYFTMLPHAHRRTPFFRIKWEEDFRIKFVCDKFGKHTLKKMYLDEWEFVKGISYKSFFIEHINIVDEHYETIYNILWDDILFTDILVPKLLIKQKCQRHLYLKKPAE